ncbi:MAG: Lnb N-terminal periplasmic domain-containing protein [Bdellovibrionota bacterium]
MILLALLLATTAHADPAWRALLHFSGAEGGRSSVASDSPFFLDKNGFKDPDAELAATKKFFAEKPQEAFCRYPARAMYLGLSGDCPRWAKWRNAINAKGAELVFAAAFLSSPSSMYGHTLLKFVRSGQSEGQDLLDYTLNYGANTGNVTGLPYVWMGLTGGFSGNYATAPFYLKVREYNFVENRDFWIYPLNLSERELALLVAHGWELRDVNFPYFFLHRNCAFYLLELLEVVRPGSNFTAHFPLWTVPVDTIRLLANSRILGTPRFRASRYRRLKALRDELQKGEDPLVDQLATTGEAPLVPGREALLLDAAYELWRYRTEAKKTDHPQVEGRLLTARSRFPEPIREVKAEELAPDQGHPSARAYAAYGLDRRNGFFEAGYRGTLQDLLASPEGYEDYSELSMGDIRVRAENGSLFLERADVLRLRSVAPREEWIPRWAWAFRTGFERAKEFACAGWDCSSGEIEAGVGAAARVGPAVGFAMLGGGVEAGKPFDRSYRVGAGPSLGLVSPLWRGARLLVEGEWRARVMGSQTGKRGATGGLSQTFSRNWEARVAAEVERGYREALAQVNFYF